MEPIHTATLPIDLHNGNTGRTKHWFANARFRSDCQALLILEGHRREPFEIPVRLLVTRILGKNQRQFDADSLQRGNLKEIIDSLVAVGWFHDDGPKWITACDCRQDDTRRSEGPAVLVEVYRDD